MEAAKQSGTERDTYKRREAANHTGAKKGSSRRCLKDTYQRKGTPKVNPTSSESTFLAAFCGVGRFGLRFQSKLPRHTWLAFQN